MFEEVESNSVDTPTEHVVAGESPILKYALIAIGLIYIAVSLYLIYGLKTRIDALDQKQQALETAQAELGTRLHATSSEFRQALSSEVGMTKAEMAKRAAQLEQEQKSAAAKLSAAQNQQGQQIAAVSGEVTGVKSEVGTAKTDIAKTQSDIQATNQKLERAIGDLGVQSGLIAHTSSELEVLKHKGDRNYYDFTLRKGAKTPISTVSLQLKKVDAKKSRFTVNVMADDRTIEKKDRTVGEPLQFYTGRDHMLYEVVVFTASKDSITGYLATPKNAPTPVKPN
jgi:multidrug efflux pump subunit AcrA (membrane-fusion protein)